MISKAKSLNRTKSSMSKNASMMKTSMISGSNSESKILGDDDDDSNSSSENEYMGTIVERKLKEWAKVNKLFKKK